jgi:hypothetical protein
MLDGCRLHEDDVGNVYVNYEYKGKTLKAAYKEVSRANVIGAPLLAKVGMQLSDELVLNDQHIALNAYTLGINMI